MDLAGSLWERCITVGDSTGRAFKGTHGHGTISYYGFGTNNDWPSGVMSGRWIPEAETLNGPLASRVLPS